MQSRRDFLKHAALMSSAMGMWGALEGSILKALAIEPEPGSSYLDAEHVVILMQENRSFDHAFGTLQGVRGYNDPRAISLPNNNSVWVQTNTAGESYAPFRLNLKDTKATWMGYLPHNWASQIDARNGGKYDRWLEAKRSGKKEYANMPLTLGHYDRQDIPFYYALADAFTVCDQHFCSAITSTSPNRLFFWLGTVREKPSLDSPAFLRNEQIFNKDLFGWTTFPERLEDHGISWKFYQNELTIKSGLNKEEESWLGNFGLNVLEDFNQYHVKFAKTHRDYLERQYRSLSAEIEAINNSAATQDPASEASQKHQEQLKNLAAQLKEIETERALYTLENFEKLPARERSLHEKAFCTNAGDPSYRQLEELPYQDGANQRTMQVPKGDVLFQFRDDVKAGKLPTVTWLAAPERFSDHPMSAWYGAWYISEVLRILTENPEVWKKTVFILTYDENDGYFDHVPPFVAPRPGHPETGFTSKSLDATLEYVELEADRKLKLKGPREGPIGLGYRVPLIVASPWNRGGCVCSQLSDNTSVIRFLEKFLTRKTGKPIEETNISSWRRGICSDLTSTFQPAASEKESNPAYLERDPFVEQINRSQFKPLPADYKPLLKEEIDEIRQDPRKSQWMPQQEQGVRRSSPLPYELYVDGSLSDDKSQFTIRFEVRKDLFGDKTVGCPFTVYARTADNDMSVRNYAVAAGDHLEDSWPLRDFAGGAYHLQAYGPNGYFREFTGSADDPPLEIRAVYSPTGAAAGAPSGNVELQITSRDASRDFNVAIADHSYKTGDQKRSVAAGKTESFIINTKNSHQWYNFGLSIEQIPDFHWNFAGRVETGKWTFSDPAMGAAVS